MYKNGIILTGPIGSGKSEALSIVSRLGYKTVDLDIISNNILNSEDSIDFLKTNFLDCLENDKVVRAKLANIVFQDKEKLQLLEAYLHPKVQSQLVDILSNSDQLTFIEVSAPKNVIDMFKTIVLWSPEKVRIERLIDRGMDLEDITNRINNQPDDDWWHSIGTVINNDVKEGDTILVSAIDTNIRVNVKQNINLT